MMSRIIKVEVRVFSHVPRGAPPFGYTPMALCELISRDQGNQNDFAVSESDFAMMKFILPLVKRLRCDSCGPSELSASRLVLYTLYFVSIIITYEVFSNTCKDTYDNVFGKYGIA